MQDGADLLKNFADVIDRHTRGKQPRFSNWIGKDLHGALDILENANPEGLINYVSSHFGLNAGKSVLDFGCGEAPHRGLLVGKGLAWTGIDYADSMDPTALARAPDVEVITYDGKTFPIADNTFDSIWSYQSLEHVFSPEETFREFARVLKPGGVLFGSTSFLEAYHARSTFCYTPYGFKLICDRHGLTLDKLFPNIDGMSLVFRYLLIILGADESKASDWHKLMKNGGAFFDLVRQRARETGNQRLIAEALAQFCGQFYFVASKPGPWRSRIQSHWPTLTALVAPRRRQRK